MLPVRQQELLTVDGNSGTACLMTCPFAGGCHLREPSLLMARTTDCSKFVISQLGAVVVQHGMVIGFRLLGHATYSSKYNRLWQGQEKDMVICQR